MSTLNVTNIKAADGTTGLTITNSTGQVTMPNSSGFVPEFVAWSVQKDGNMTIANGAQTQVTWQTENFDTHNAFAGNAFTVPSGQGGYYNVGFFVNWKDTWTAQIIHYIRVNSSVKATFMERKEGNEMGEGGSQILQVNAGDVIDIAVYQPSGSNKEIYGSDNTSTRFWGYRIG